jgi:hypothetical protein
MSSHPFDDERPLEHPLRDVQMLAHDLAYGAVTGEWNAVITSFRGNLNFLDEERPNHARFMKKWQVGSDNGPRLDLLIALGYLEHVEVGNSGQVAYFRITKTSFGLLSAPFVPSRIFVSYRRRESSAFALLIEARLRLAGVPAEAIFVDKNMHGGERWESRIYRELEQTDYFICLVGSTTLIKGSWVNREIEVLKEVRPQSTVIPVCHNGTRLVSLPPVLAKSNGYEIGKPQEEETALDYEMATNFILNSLGYKTY